MLSFFKKSNFLHLILFRGPNERLCKILASYIKQKIVPYLLITFFIYRRGKFGNAMGKKPRQSLSRRWSTHVACREGTEAAQATDQQSAVSAASHSLRLSSYPLWTCPLSILIVKFSPRWTCDDVTYSLARLFVGSLVRYSHLSNDAAFQALCHHRVHIVRFHWWYLFDHGWYFDDHCSTSFSTFYPGIVNF